MKKKLTVIWTMIALTLLSISVVDAAETAGSDTAALEEDIDYVKGRPLTEEEINQQQEMEPDSFGAMDLGSGIARVGSDTIGRSTWASLPSNYSLLDLGKITSVKNQANSGLCWAFSALASGESNLLAKNVGTYDLSEAQLGYFTYGNVLPKGCEGDQINLINSQNWYNVGGNDIVTTFALSRWVGASDESTAPFQTASKSTTYGEDLSYSKDTAHLKNADWISLSDSSAVKEYLMQNGAMNFPFYYSSSNLNYDTMAYYNATQTSINHAVSLVGWDDTYKKENFNSDNAPAGDGAWLCKNSWGTGWGDDGYFWISYYDRSLTDEDATAYGYQMVAAADDYSYNYQYDGSGYVEYTSFPSNSGKGLNADNYMSNVFTADSDEDLKAVSFAVGEANTGYEIQIYKDVVDIPTSGTAVYGSAVTGTCEYSGYHTVDLSESVYLEAGEKFAVVINLKSEYGDAQFPVDKTNTRIANWVEFISNSKAGQSYISADNKTWKDLSAAGDSNLRIKAFTDKAPEKKDINTVSYSSIADITYTGSAAEPSVALTDGNYTLTEGTDYTITYKNNANIGTASILIKGIGQYNRTLEIPFQIVAISIKTAVISNISNAAYSGKAITPTPSVTLNGRTLSSSADYTLSYKNNISPGIATVTVTGKGNYTGTVSSNFTITITKTGWSKVGNDWYYTQASGVPLKNAWVKSSGLWYYMDAAGKMAVNTLVDGNNYYVDRSGVMMTGWIRSGSSWYYASASGYLVRDQWHHLQNVWYYFNTDRKMATGWITLGGTKYYMKDSGAMATEWQKVGNSWYYLKSSGAMATGWQNINNTWYYLNSSGSMATGWVKDGATWYYMRSSGAMAVGWIKLGNEWYYMKSSGAMATGWINVGGTWYYLYDSGVMAANTWIDNYFVDAGGAWTQTR